MKLVTEKGNCSLQVGLDNVFRNSESGKFSLMPEGNRMALRGKWIDEEHFFLDFYEIGRAEQPQLVIRFDENKIGIRCRIIPSNYRFRFEGRSAGVLSR